MVNLPSSLPTQMPEAPKPTRSWSPYQQAIFDAIVRGQGNGVVEAVAGSGKTTTMVEAIKQWKAVNLHRSAIFVAFNKSIAMELQERVPAGVDASTLHSACYKSIGRRFKGCRVDDKKLFDTVDAVSEQHGYSKQAIDWDVKTLAWAISEDLCRIYGLLKGTMTDLNDVGAIGDVLADYAILLKAPMQSIPMVAALDKAMRADTTRISFDEMLSFMVDFAILPVQTYDLVCVDESQDMNLLQIAILKTLVSKGGRLWAVGDTHQCQPAGTLVSLTGGSEIPIENIRKGDDVVSLDRHGHSFVGRSQPCVKVEQVASREYTGRMYTVRAGSKSSDCTDNHQWLVRFQRDTKVWVTYMMSRDNHYRVGWCQLFQKDGVNQLAHRARIERADAVWVLGVHHSKAEASLEESFIAARWGIPLPMFQQAAGNFIYTQKNLDQFFARIGDAVDLGDRAEQCLTHYNRSIDFPFVTLDKGWVRRGRTTCCVVAAANLVESLMEVPVYEGQKEPKWVPVRVTSRQVVRERVYSLKVQHHELYVSNGMLTHNSIYRFRGADNGAMDRIRSEFDVPEQNQLPLSITYRCPKAVVRQAQSIVEHLRAADNAEEGTVIEAVAAAWRQTLLNLKEGTSMVICRSNAPLVKAVLHLIRHGRKAVIKGRDVGKSLQKLAKDIGRRNGGSIAAFIDGLEKFRNKEAVKLDARRQANQLQALHDRCDTLLVLLDSVDHPFELEAKIDSIFSDNLGQGIILSTVHKAKGLESPTVVFLKPEIIDFIASKCAEKEDFAGVTQEENLKYVAITRAQKVLIYQPLPRNDEEDGGDG